MRWPWWDPYLIVVLLGHQPTLSQHKVQGSTGHERPVAQVTKHNREQEGEGDDGVWRWRRGVGEAGSTWGEGGVAGETTYEWIHMSQYTACSNKAIMGDDAE